MVAFMLSCSKEDSINEGSSAFGAIEVTVFLGEEPAEGALIFTTPETKTMNTGSTGMAQFTNIEPGTYRVNVVINDDFDFIYFQDVTVVADNTNIITFPLLAIPDLEELPLDVGFLLEQSYRDLGKIFNANEYLAYWGDTGTDIMKANRMVDGSLVELDAYFITPQLNRIAEVWTEHYQQVRNVNVGLDYLLSPDYVVSPDIDARVVEAEFKFLRALLYFNLIKMYGNPLLSTTAKIDLNGPPNYPQNPDTTFDQIEDDLLFAVQHLPITSGSNAKANQLSARGLLAKVYLSMAGFPLSDISKYAEALAQVKVIEGQYELISDYKTIFNEDNETQNREVMFRISFTGGQNSSSNFNQFWGPLGVSERDALVLVPGFPDTFGAQVKFENPVDFPIVLRDQRFFNAIATFTVNGNTRIDSPDPAFWRPLKWYNGTIEEANFNSDAFDYPLLRYADILLILAEAENEINGPTQIAYNAINKIRERAYGTTENNLPVGLSSAEFLEAVLLERKLELCFEGHRRDDLIRRQQLEAVINQYNVENDFQKDFQPHEYIWPLPQIELDLNPNAIQNPGY